MAAQIHFWIYPLWRRANQKKKMRRLPALKRSLPWFSAIGNCWISLASSMESFLFPASSFFPAACLSHLRHSFVAFASRMELFFLAVETETSLLKRWRWYWKRQRWGGRRWQGHSGVVDRYWNDRRGWRTRWTPPSCLPFYTATNDWGSASCFGRHQFTLAGWHNSVRWWSYR